MVSTRPIILHFHIFKNAGTSLDLTLERNFGRRWAAIESTGRGSRLRPDEVVEYLTIRPSLAAVSSHTMEILRVDPPGLTAISIVFLRHPLDRARSIWEFNRRRPDDVPFGALAKQLDLPEYLESGLARREGSDASVADHQTRWLGRDGNGGTMLERARDTLGTFGVVGLVEEYRQSITRIQQAAAPWFPELRLRALHANPRPAPATHRILRYLGRETDLDTRLHALRKDIGDDLYRRLEGANQGDLELWKEVRATYSRRQ
jgi:hypothetical protein